MNKVIILEKDSGYDLQEEINKEIRDLDRDTQIVDIKYQMVVTGEGLLPIINYSAMLIIKT